MEASKLLIAAGLLIAAAGVVLKYAPWLITWFGKLPGDINIEGEHSRVFIPITSMIVISVVLSIVINLLRK